MPTVCSNCGGTDIEYDAGRGDAVCTGCGSVLEDNIIVSEVTFQEQTSGSSSLVGQFVSNENASGQRGLLAGSGFHHGLGRDSREATLQQAKKRLSHLGNLLKLNQHCIDTAFGFFKMALQLNLTRGRKSSIMDTACLYLVCRSEGTPHMLLDFSDVLQINVYSLGRAYLKLSTSLHINPPAIDPCLYIHRFAHKLELGDKVHDVSMTALRLVARMKRDWIHHGRRPAGLCGASLLVASRLHNFNRSVKEIARVVKLSEGTIRKRLGDFKDTPSSRLSIDDFLKIDLEQEHDPPCFLEAKKKAKHPPQTTDCSETINDEDDVSTVGDDDQEEDTGYGGIKVSSVEDIIAKARMAEAFLNVPTAGLSGNLSELAQLEEDTQTQQTEGLCHNEEQNGEGSSSSKCDHTLTGEVNGELDLEGISDGEIEQMLLSEKEVEIKTKLWFAENGDFLKELEAKRERQAIIQAEKDLKPKKRVNRKKKKDAYQTPASTAGEAIERMLVEKKISSKINYDVLRDLDKTWQGGVATDINKDDVVESDGLEPGLSSSSVDIVKSPDASTTRLPSLTRKRTDPMIASSFQQPLKMMKTDDSIKMSDSYSTANNDILTKVEETIQKETVNRLSVINNNEEIVEEVGPVQYDDEEDEEERWDGDIDDMVYDGDPLLNSDYEDDD